MEDEAYLLQDLEPIKHDPEKVFEVSTIATYSVSLLRTMHNKLPQIHGEWLKYVKLI